MLDVNCIVFILIGISKNHFPFKSQNFTATRKRNHINSGNEGKVKDKERKYEPKYRIFLENGNPNSTARV